MNKKTIIRAIVGLSLPMAMAACSQGGYSGFPYELESLKTTPPTGSPFTQNLSKDYLAMAEANQSAYDWPVMSLWAHKGLKADHGDAVAPQMVDDWNYGSLQLGGVNGTFFTPDAGAAVPLKEARGRLMAMLGSNAPTAFPEWAATAQTKFDCWLEATHEATGEATAGDCRKGFENAMLLINSPPKQAEATPAPAPAAAMTKMTQTAYIVFFDFDKSDLKPEARAIIAGAAKAINAGNGVRIKVDGFTDTMGTVPYNFALSDRRGDAVERELVSDGVSADSIAVVGKGKGDLLVQTADEVREPKNRRATIELMIQ